MRVYVAWEQVSGLEHPGAWFRRVLINLCTDVTRRRSRERAALAPATEPVKGFETRAELFVLDVGLS